MSTWWHTLSNWSVLEKTRRVTLMKMNCLIHALTLTLMAIGGALAQSPSGGAVPVTVENFVRAETDLYFGGRVKLGGFGKFAHLRELAPADRREVVRPNQDTLYSSAVFDLDAGPVTDIVPNAGNRYMSMQLIDEDQFTQAAIYGAGSYTLLWGKGLYAVHRCPCAHSR
jgi:hypothetical protein